MANKIYYSKTSRTGGAAIDLDSIDGSLLTDGDFAHVTIDGTIEVYKLVDPSSSPAGSFPPATNPGTKRWEVLLPGNYPGRINKTQADSPYTIPVAALTGNTIFTNTGASGQIIFQLLAGFDGAVFNGVVTAAQYMQFLCNGTEKIRWRNIQSAAGGYFRSNVIGNIITGVWAGTEYVIEVGGAWTYDS